MARPAITQIQSGNQGWDGVLNDDLDILTDAPIPIPEDASITSLAALQTAYPAASYDRCFIWINLTTYGMTLCWSNGAAWITYGTDKRPIRSVSITTAQLITDKFVRFTGAGSVDYDFLTVSAWAGHTVTIRNDSSAAINLDPNGTELINGSSGSLSLAVSSTAVVYNDGAFLYAGIMS